MNYKLSKSDDAKEREKGVVTTALRRLVPLLLTEWRSVSIALAAILISSTTTLVAPAIIAHIVDTYIRTNDFAGVLDFSALLFVVYLVGAASSYLQVRTMGGVGRRILFSLRNAIFNKLESLPVAFFNQNKAGDLISRINNDTDKLNQFFAQALMQFVSNIVLIIGAGIFLIVINPALGAAALVPALIVIILTQIISPWVKRTNLVSLRALGNMSGEVQESLNNFKVIVAFNRLDYFRDKFKEANERNYMASIIAGIANNILTPLYTLASTAAQLIVLAYGIYLITTGSFTVGLLIGFILYVNNFYNPLRQLASVWSSLQLALAGLDRISEVLALESDMQVILTEGTQRDEDSILAFDHVSFGYPDGDKDVLHDINFSLARGKTYALVGPTGGGKTTTASLMARLYDPTQGTVYLGGRDIRSYEPHERAKRVGFILQEPFLFTGTVKENILYGNDEYAAYTTQEVETLLHESNLDPLLARFNEGLDTKITSGNDAISLGQKQLIAFMRAVLRKPDILILDEATANIDTITEQLLDDILKKLPPETTRVIIAHRLNTIENADEIFFVNGGEMKRAGTMQQAVDMLMHNKRDS
ncbi:MAG TPA: ABC transporter ATP-binding protein [Candidatus Paceibacterota bacterium]|nr:ABC transporter ATP-binding protein [Candidatus Paceibacterota bacterium]